MATGEIDFSNGWSDADLEDHLKELARGRLPGRWGLLQDLVGHWAIPRQERGWLRYGKAVLDSLGAVLTYRESQRDVVDGARNATLAWLRERGHEEAFRDDLPGLGSFVRGALAGVPRRERRVRDRLGQLDDMSLLEFDLGQGRLAYVVDVSPRRQQGTTGWVGPYCRPAERRALERFLREAIWERLGTRTLLLGASVGGLRHEPRFRLSGLPDALDFVSACEAFNDAERLAARCQAFLDNGCSRTLLFQGPPGTGKSTLARALARALERRTVLLAADAIQHLADATTLKILSVLEPGVVVLNDVDRLPHTEQLALLHGLEQIAPLPLLTVLTANDAATLDPALLRPGRIHEHHAVVEPSRASRERIVRYYAERLGVALSEEELETVLDGSDGFSPADLREFCDTAAAVGVALALDELARIEEQRRLYAGDRCERYNRDRGAGPAWRRGLRRVAQP